MTVHVDALHLIRASDAEVQTLVLYAGVTPVRIRAITNEAAAPLREWLVARDWQISEQAGFAGSVLYAERPVRASQAVQDPVTLTWSWEDPASDAGDDPAKLVVRQASQDPVTPTWSVGQDPARIKVEDPALARVKEFSRGPAITAWWVDEDPVYFTPTTWAEITDRLRP